MCKTVQERYVDWLHLLPHPQTILGEPGGGWSLCLLKDLRKHSPKQRIFEPLKRKEERRKEESVDNRIKAEVKDSLSLDHSEKQLLVSFVKKERR